MAAKTGAAARKRYSGHENDDAGRKERTMDLMQWLTETAGGEFLWTMLVSMVPVVELRGGIPFGVAAGLPVCRVFTEAFLSVYTSVPAVSTSRHRACAVPVTASLPRVCCKYENSLLPATPPRAAPMASGVPDFVSIAPDFSERLLQTF